MWMILKLIRYMNCKWNGSKYNKQNENNWISQNGNGPNTLTTMVLIVVGIITIVILNITIMTKTTI